MGSCLGILRWTPDVFRRTTFYEYTAAMKAHLSAKGVKITEAVSRDEFLEMKAADEVEQRKRGN